MQKVTYYIIVVLCLCTLTIMLKQWRDYQQLREDWAEHPPGDIELIFDYVVADYEEEFSVYKPIQAVAQQIMNELTDNTDLSELKEILENHLADNKEIIGEIWVFFEPTVYPLPENTKHGRYILAFFDENEELTLSDVSFTKAEENWYIEDGFYTSTITGTAGLYFFGTLPTFIQPFHFQGKVAGVIEVVPKEIGLEFGDDGAFKALQPEEELKLEEGESTDTKLCDDKYPNIRTGFDQENDKKKANWKVLRLGVKQTTWCVAKPLEKSGRVIFGAINEIPDINKVNEYNQRMIAIISNLILFLLALAALVFRVNQGDTPNLWAFSFLTGLLFLIGTGYLLYLEIERPYVNPDDEYILDNQVLIDKLIEQDELIPKINKTGNPPYHIPTGLLIESMAEGPNEATFSGIVWQRYPINYSANLKKGVMFSDITGDDSPYLEEIYRVEEGDDEIIGWAFKVTIRQPPSIDNYPVDKDAMQIQLLPKELVYPVVLVPDLGARYDWMDNPDMSNVFLEGWDFGKSFYSYRYDPYGVNFGSDKISFGYSVSSLYLYFNAPITRLYQSPFISYGITIFVVMVLLFAIMILSVDNALEILSYSAAQFFVVAITHIGLRGELAADNMVFLEYMFVIMYGIILMVSINGMLYRSGEQLPLIHYRNNLIPKLLYWPLTAGILLLITIYLLYPGKTWWRDYTLKQVSEQIWSDDEDTKEPEKTSIEELDEYVKDLKDELDQRE